MEWWGHRGAVQQISWNLPYDLVKPWKISVRKLSRALSSVTSHYFKWGPFPPNEVVRATLPAPLAKPIGPSQKNVLKNLRSGSEDPGTSGGPLRITLLFCILTGACGVLCIRCWDAVLVLKFAILLASTINTEVNYKSANCT